MDFEQSLKEIIVDMLCKINGEYTFYGLFLAELNKSFSDRELNGSPLTACVAKHRNSNGIELIIGKEFWEKNCKTNSMKTCIIIHELLHVANEHLSQMAEGMFPDKKIANLAMDIYINQQIKENFPVDEEGNTMGIFLSTFPELNLLPNMPSLWYYERLKTAKNKKEASEGKCDNMCDAPGNMKGTSGSKNLDAIIESGEDIHVTWDEITEGMTDMEKELFRKELMGTLERLAEETLKTKGTVPANIQAILSARITPDKPVISWKSLFQRFVGSCVSTEQYQTRKRPNLRFEDSPASRNKQKIKGIVLCDSSGSMNKHDMDQINSQLYHIWKTGVGVDFASWDADCAPHKKYDGKLVFERVKSGGTRLGCAIEYVNDNLSKNRWDFAIIGTDGYVEHDPPTCKIPCMILITSNGSMDINTKHKLIKINE